MKCFKSAPKHVADKTAAPSKRTQATRKLVARLAGCLAMIVIIYVVQATGDISTRLTLLLSGAVLAAGAFCVGVWTQLMWPKEE